MIVEESLREIEMITKTKMIEMIDPGGEMMIGIMVLLVKETELGIVKRNMMITSEIGLDLEKEKGLRIIEEEKGQMIDQDLEKDKVLKIGLDLEKEKDLKTEMCLEKELCQGEEIGQDRCSINWWHLIYV